MPGIVWLASYPKSGNTWLRAFLANYATDAAAPVSINALFDTSVASSMRHLDEQLAIDAGDLTPDECDNLRPETYRRLAASAPSSPRLKVHDRNGPAPTGEALFPPEATAATVYVVRDPRDVAVSLAHHDGVTTAAAIDRMANPEATLAERAAAGLPIQLRQKLGTWSDHVQSWIDDPHMGVTVLRYEDMLADPVATFGRAVAAVGEVADAARLERAVRSSAFAELRRQEAEDGFREAAPAAERFFRRGEAGAWRDALSPADVARIESDHAEVMARLGYVPDAEGTPPSASVPGLRA